MFYLYSFTMAHKWHQSLFKKARIWLFAESIRGLEHLLIECKKILKE